MILFLLFLAFLIFQRISELLLARKNETAVRKMGALEYDSGGYRTIVLMHAAFFLSLVSEYLILGRALNGHWPILIAIFLLTQALRYWSILSLGKFWNTKILVVPGARAVTRGPYKYLRHPNYLAVVLEIAVVPLIFSCYITSALFTVLNLIALRRRIKIEESALLGSPSENETAA
jgi:methyltransferase